MQTCSFLSKIGRIQILSIYLIIAIYKYPCVIRAVSPLDA